MESFIKNLNQYIYVWIGIGFILGIMGLFIWLPLLILSIGYIVGLTTVWARNLFIYKL